MGGLAIRSCPLDNCTFRWPGPNFFCFKNFLDFWLGALWEIFLWFGWPLTHPMSAITENVLPFYPNAKFRWWLYVPLFCALSGLFLAILEENWANCCKFLDFIYLRQIRRFSNARPFPRFVINLFRFGPFCWFACGCCSGDRSSNWL